ncbi:MAG: hypothetical protein LAP40_09505 [Acidobacteriia bacterium]|nr:hypothetical protein [Terriglobia bacterium]
MFRAGTPKMLFDKPGFYDVAPDGKRFLLLKPVAAPDQQTEVHVVLNWVEEVRRRVPAIQ